MCPAAAERCRQALAQLSVGERVSEIVRRLQLGHAGDGITGVGHRPALAGHIPEGRCRHVGCK